MKKRKSSERITSFIANNPAWSVAKIAEKFRVSKPYVYGLRKKVMDEFFSPPELLPVPPAPEPTLVDGVLDARAVEYGTFADGAALMQSIKRTLADHAQRHGKTFADDQWEALEMIVHKMARIVNGNPDNVDSWRDISGYAVLIADRLEGNAR